MVVKGYEYQYDTTPRKLDLDYGKQKKSTPKKKTVQTTKKQPPKKNTAAVKKKVTTKKNKKEEEKKAQKMLIIKTKFSIFVKCAVLFGIIFLILFRNSQINESFAKIQKLKSEITAIQKENDQIEINIQNSMNSNNLEQKAKDLLGMQKLTNKQIVYINIPKKDYVEYKAEEIIIEEEKSFFENIIDKIKELF